MNEILNLIGLALNASGELLSILSSFLELRRTVSAVCAFPPELVASALVCV